MLYSTISCTVYYMLNKPTCTRPFSFALTISLRIYLTHWIQSLYSVTDLPFSRTTLSISCWSLRHSLEARMSRGLTESDHHKSLTIHRHERPKTKYRARTRMDHRFGTYHILLQNIGSGFPWITFEIRARVRGSLC